MMRRQQVEKRGHESGSGQERADETVGEVGALQTQQKERVSCHVNPPHGFPWSLVGTDLWVHSERYRVRNVKVCGWPVLPLQLRQALIMLRQASQDRRHSYAPVGAQTPRPCVVEVLKGSGGRSRLWCPACERAA
mmetsp:Transcript_15427/g.42396  ORF Transcript_15427/g.42396 Transcript_15427/m.42396 type:complete len:135 (-) Transcript_15427:7-411(-)